MKPLTVSFSIHFLKAVPLTLISLCALTACPLNHMKVLKAENCPSLTKLNKDLHIQLAWLEGPYGEPEKKSTLHLKVLDKDKTPVSLAPGHQFFIQASMGMGHGLLNRGEFKSLDQIEWINDHISFYMPGDYDIKIYLTDENYNEMGEASWCSTF
jgi:hypothetical protein